MGISSLNLGGDDKKLETPPSGPPTVEESKSAAAPKVAEAPVVAAPTADVLERWSSHPILRFTVGPFVFENGLLQLTTEKQVADFKEVYDSLPIYEQNRMKKIDLSAAEAVSRALQATAGGATQSIDSSTGNRAPNNQVGSGDLLAGSTDQ